MWILSNIHMWILSNIPLWVLVFATLMYDVSMVQQCECCTGQSKILENISTRGFILVTCAFLVTTRWYNFHYYTIEPSSLHSHRWNIFQYNHSFIVILTVVYWFYGMIIFTCEYYHTINPMCSLTHSGTLGVPQVCYSMFAIIGQTHVR